MTRAVSAPTKESINRMAFSTFDTLVTQLEQAAAASGDRSLGDGAPRALRAIAHEINNVLGSSQLEIWICETSCESLDEALTQNDVGATRRYLAQIAESHTALSDSMKKLASIANRLAAADIPAANQPPAPGIAPTYSLNSQLALANST